MYGVVKFLCIAGEGAGLYAGVLLHPAKAVRAILAAKTHAIAFFNLKIASFAIYFVTKT
jgi:hypothetical protein